jgi:hypothetical protein
MRVEPPVRVTHSYVQRLAAAPARVFPLLCPVREAEWVAGWDPELVVSASGVAEPDCVFTTRDDAGREAVWTVTRHEPDRHRLELLKVVPGLVVTKVEIALAPDRDGDTEATVTYTHTALSAEGRHFVAATTAEVYAAFMAEWEAELNRYLGAAPSSRAGR